VVGDEEQLVTPHDPVGLADALERLAGTPARVPRLARPIGRAALERYDRRKVAARILSFYSACWRPGAYVGRLEPLAEEAQS